MNLILMALFAVNIGVAIANENWAAFCGWTAAALGAVFRIIEQRKP